MIRRLLRRDTLNRRIALTILAAMLASLALNALFVQVAGVWARPPIDRTGLLEQMAATLKVIEAAPAPLRSHLAAAASDTRLQVTWHTNPVDFGLPSGGNVLQAGEVPGIQALFGTGRTIQV